MRTSWMAMPAALLIVCACTGGGSAGGSGVEGREVARSPAGDPRPAGSALTSVGAVVTTVIVVRHAEKAAGGGEDPHLSDEGRARAAALAQALDGAGVDAVITTQFVRTGETAGPTARDARVVPEVLTVRWDSVARNAADVAAAVRRHSGGVVLVVGHSNTVPDIVAALGASKPDAICDSEYDRMEIVTVEANGRARLIEARYGAPTPARVGCAAM